MLYQHVLRHDISEKSDVQMTTRPYKLQNIETAIELQDVSERIIITATCRINSKGFIQSQPVMCTQLTTALLS